MMMRPLRVVVAKPGLDGHDRGAKIIARAFRDAGMEVIYTGIFQTTEMIVRTVVEEDADVLGLSILSGAHLHFADEVCRSLREQAAKDVLVVMGGILPPDDIPRVKASGVSEVFGPGTPTSQIVDYVRERCAPR
jgi:methylmalonyl-CoA mutase C-terminal domain/subunit